MLQRTLRTDIYVFEKMIDKKLKDFATLVKKMREAQKNYYVEKPILGRDVTYKNMINKEYQVDKWLEELL